MNSYLEDKFVAMLNNNYPNLKYIREFEDINIQNKIGKKVRYDFYFPSLNLIIELDGIQHYSPKKVGYDKWFKINQMDNKKESIAKNHGYKFGRIRSTYKNLLKIFEKHLART